MYIFSKPTFKCEKIRWAIFNVAKCDRIYLCSWMAQCHFVSPPDHDEAHQCEICKSTERSQRENNYCLRLGIWVARNLGEKDCSEKSKKKMPEEILGPSGFQKLPKMQKISKCNTVCFVSSNSLSKPGICWH